MQAGSPFGIFTERDYVHNVVPFDERSPQEISLAEVARFSSGVSKATMREYAPGIATSPHLFPPLQRARQMPTGAPCDRYAAKPCLAWGTYRPDNVTCVERSTRVKDCLSLMLGNGLLYVPVTEDKKPVNVVSMRDINLFLTPEVS